MKKVIFLFIVSWLIFLIGCTNPVTYVDASGNYVFEDQNVKIVFDGDRQEIQARHYLEYDPYITIWGATNDSYPYDSHIIADGRIRYRDRDVVWSGQNLRNDQKIDIELEVEDYTYFYTVYLEFTE